MTRHLMAFGTQTPSVTTDTNPFPSDYEVWLSGYWEDFTSSYSIPEAINNKLSNDSTHFGNPMNGEAKLNPYYRWC